MTKQDRPVRLVGAPWVRVNYISTKKYSYQNLGPAPKVEYKAGV